MLSDAPIPARQTPMGTLRALKREGFPNLGRVQALLRQIRTTLDLEAAGAMLATKGGAGLAAAPGAREERIALTGSSTFNSVPNLLTATLVERGIVPKVHLGDFNQWRFEMLAEKPSFAALEPRLVACLLDESTVFEAVGSAVDPDAVERACDAFPAELERWVDACQKAVGATVIVSTIPLSSLSVDRVIDYRNKARILAAFQHMNGRILALGASKVGVVALDLAALSLRSGRLFAPERMRQATGQVYDAELLRAYAEELGKVSVASLGLASKCLVLDLDNTLWGGVIGDDGMEGITLGGAYPATGYQALQALARDLMTQGVMLTVASKNDDAIARQALRSHPDMLLRSEQFVAINANWDPKPRNLREQSLKLNVGLDAMVFVDDNPAERELMRQSLPQVETLELPTEPAEYAGFVAASGVFNLLQVTEEDRNRTAMYRARAERADLERSADNLEDYLQSLESRLRLAPLDALNRGRIVQLFGKTNQFNMTGIRFTDDEVAGRLEEGTAQFVCARLEDRFGDNGIIGALAIGLGPDQAWEIENFVLSCRVFSRNVEQAIVSLLLSAARSACVPEVRAAFSETPKNKKFSRFYDDLGFVRFEVEGATRFVHRLNDIPEPPSWVRVEGDTEVFHAF